MSFEQVAHMINVSTPTARNLIRHGARMARNRLFKNDQYENQ